MQTYQQDNLLQEACSESYVLSGFSPYDDDPDQDQDEILEQYDFEYILARTRRTYPALAEEDAKDVAQDVHISLWRKLQKGTINNPPAYIAYMIRNKCIDRFRQNKCHSHLHVLSLSENSDALEGKVGLLLSPGIADPAGELEEKVAANDSFKEIIEAVLALPPRQRYALICVLLEKGDDLWQLVETFQAHNLDIYAFGWPESKAEKQLLQASLYAARLFLARRLHVDLSQYKRRKRLA